MAAMVCWVGWCLLVFVGSDIGHWFRHEIFQKSNFQFPWRVVAIPASNWHSWSCYLPNFWLSTLSSEEASNILFSTLSTYIRLSIRGRNVTRFIDLTIPTSTSSTRLHLPKPMAVGDLVADNCISKVKNSKLSKRIRNRSKMSDNIVKFLHWWPHHHRASRRKVHGRFTEPGKANEGRLSVHFVFISGSSTRCADCHDQWDLHPLWSIKIFSRRSVKICSRWSTEIFYRWSIKISYSYRFSAFWLRSCIRAPTDVPSRHPNYRCSIKTSHHNWSDQLQSMVHHGFLGYGNNCTNLNLISGYGS